MCRINQDRVFWMEELLEQKVFETMDDVFGVLFSITSRPFNKFSSKKTNDPEESYIEVRVDVSRGDKFPAYFFFPEKLALVVAHNFMGMDDIGTGDDRIKEVVSEAARITIGGLLGKIDPAARCDVGTPVPRRLEGFCPSLLDGAFGTCAYETEFGCLWMDLSNIEKCCQKS